jgi:hypothetical protein
MKFLLWCILFTISWPLALLALVLWPLVWVIALPFRLLGKTVSGAIDLALGLVMLPIRLPLRLLRG